MLSISAPARASCTPDKGVPSQLNPMTTTQALQGDAFSFLSLREVAATFRVAPVTIYRLVASRALPVYRVAKKLLFKRDDVERYVTAQRQEPRNPTLWQ